MDEEYTFDPDWSVDSVLMARRVASNAKPRPVRNRQIQKARGRKRCDPIDLLIGFACLETGGGVVDGEVRG